MSNHRLKALKNILSSSGPLTLDQLAEMTGSSRRSIQRWIGELRELGIPVVEESSARAKRFWIRPPETELLSFGPADLITLEMACSLIRSLAGTGFAENMAAIAERLAAHAPSCAIDLRNRFRERWLDVTEAEYDYSGRSDDCDAIVTAILREESIEVSHVAVEEGQKRFLVDPYGLIHDHDGLHVVGRSSHHDAVHAFRLDELSEIRWLRQKKFVRPADFDLKSFSTSILPAFGGAQPSSMQWMTW